MGFLDTNKMPVNQIHWYPILFVEDASGEFNLVMMYCYDDLAFT